MNRPNYDESLVLDSYFITSYLVHTAVNCRLKKVLLLKNVKFYYPKTHFVLQKIANFIKYCHLFHDLNMLLDVYFKLYFNTHIAYDMTAMLLLLILSF